MLTDTSARRGASAEIDSLSRSPFERIDQNRQTSPPISDIMVRHRRKFAAYYEAERFFCDRAHPDGRLIVYGGGFCGFGHSLLAGIGVTKRKKSRLGLQLLESLCFKADSHKYLCNERKTLMASGAGAVRALPRALALRNRVGRFFVRADIIESDVPAALAALAGCIIIRADVTSYRPLIEYVAMSEDFDEVLPDAVEPLYECNLREREDGSVIRTWKRCDPESDDDLLMQSGLVGTGPVTVH
jgi:hypothetical protein